VNVVFDLAGVIVSYDEAAVVTNAFRDPAAQDTVRAAIIGHSDWRALDRGTLSEQDAIIRAARRTGLPAADIAAFMKQIYSAWVTIPETVDLLYRVRSSGHRLFCLSNMHAGSIDYMEQVYSFWEVFAGKIISCHVHSIKPEREIYTQLLNRYGLECSDTVFIDDTEINLEAAAQLGLRAIKFQNPAQCESELRALGCIYRTCIMQMV